MHGTASVCAGWSAQQVAGHAAWLIKNLGSIAAGGAFIDGEAEELVLGDRPAQRTPPRTIPRWLG